MTIPDTFKVRFTRDELLNARIVEGRVPKHCGLTLQGLLYLYQLVKNEVNIRPYTENAVNILIKKGVCVLEGGELRLAC